MRIHRLHIADFRGVQSCEVEFSTSGVTIIEGDNESGKSTLLNALDLLFEYRSDSKSRHVTAAQPVGQDVGPSAEADLTIGGQRLTIRKRWIKNQETVLTIHGTPDRQITGQEAHNALREIIDTHLDGDLYNALRLAQGTELSQASLATRTLSGALDAAAGNDTAGGREDSLWEAIQAERSRYATTTGVPSQERKNLQKAVDQAEEDVESLRNTSAQLEADIASLAQVSSHIDELDGRAAEQRHLIDELNETMAKIGATRTVLREAETELSNRQGGLQLATERSEVRAALTTKLAERRQDLEDAIEAQSTSDAATGDLSARQEALTSSRGMAKEELKAARDAETAAAADHDLAKDLIDLELLEERLKKYGRAQQLLADAESRLDDLTIDDGLLSEIESAHEQFLIASSLAQEQAVALKVEAFEDVDITGAGLDGRLEPGSVTETFISDHIELTVPERLRISLTPGGSAEDTRERMMAADEQRSRLLQQAGVDDVVSARVALNTKRQAEQDRAERRTEIDGLLRDLTPESLRAKVERLQASIAASQATRDPARPLPSDLEHAEEIHTQAQAEVQRKINDVEAAESALSEFRTTLQESQVEQAQRATRVQQAQHEFDEADRALDEARSQMSDDELQAAAETSAEAVATARAAVDDAITQLTALDAESTETRFNNALAALERTERELSGARQEHAEASISLRLRGEQGLASELDDANRELERLTAQRNRLEEKAAAAELLHSVFDRHRAAARERYAAPLRDEIERLGRLVFGEGVGVELDDDLRIIGRELDGRSVPFEHLSVGAQEQLGLLARLACASLVGGQDGEGAPVILDDALGWTDPDRVERMGTAISATSQDVQVIILTCTPKRYAAVGNASVIRLPTKA
jgi:DNA repair exonuclease SbcCD ATPase subunit